MSATGKNKIILPGSTIGILGGGQLGRMMALSGRHMGYRFITLDPTEDSPCGQVADRQITAAYDDLSAAEQLAEQADVITYEFENVNARVVELLSSKAYVPQGSELLSITQHRLREKRAVQEAGAKVAPYAEITSEAQLTDELRRLGLPSVLKTATGGYDGKGQRVIRRQEEAKAAYAELSQANTELILEQFIPFVKEISVIAARNPNGETATFPVAENIHIDNILHMSIVPARISREICNNAEAVAKNIAENLDVIGLLAVKMFVAANGEIFVNELAPRPHNSGHYTMEACKTSQFEQHIRAICNLPLGSTELMSPVVMVNVLGEHVEALLDSLPRWETPDNIEVKIHLYGKKEAKTKRKMGHINVLADDVETALRWIEQLPVWKQNVTPV